MKIRQLIFFLLFITLGSGSVMAQNNGELNRFSTSEMDKVNKVSLYPNPTIDYLQVKIDNSNLKDAEFTLYNVIGNPVEVKLTEQEEDVFVIDVRDLPAGYYFLAIRDENSYFRETYKFVKR